MQGEHLVVVAPPDDEVVFFGGLIQRLVADREAVTVLCATGRFGSAWSDRVRARELRSAARLLGVRASSLGLIDGPGPLAQQLLRARLAAAVGGREFVSVHTHGLLGEYGHRHHADVCVAVHDVLAQPWSLAGPLAPERCLVLDDRERMRKRELVRRAYPSQGFAAAWCTASECFVRLTPDFVAACASDAALAIKDRPLVSRAHQRLEGGPPSPELAAIPPAVWRDAMRMWRDRPEAKLL